MPEEIVRQCIAEELRMVTDASGITSIKRCRLSLMGKGDKSEIYGCLTCRETLAVAAFSAVLDSDSMIE